MNHPKLRSIAHSLHRFRDKSQMTYHPHRNLRVLLARLRFFALIVAATSSNASGPPLPGRYTGKVDDGIISFVIHPERYRVSRIRCRFTVTDPRFQGSPIDPQT